MTQNIAGTILIIEKNLRNLELLSQFLEENCYRSLPVSELGEIDSLLEKEKAIDMALVDITGFDNSIWSKCEQIRSQGIQLLIISARQSLLLQQESIKHGASGVLIKPLVMKELAGFIKQLLKN